MKCPECKQDEAYIMHEDPIQCADCACIMDIGYCVCTECGYTFRTNNGKFMDGVSIDDALDEVLAGLKESQGEMCGLLNVSMMDLIHNCIKCGEPAGYEKNSHVYGCGVCGFEWEILSNE